MSSSYTSCRAPCVPCPPLPWPVSTSQKALPWPCTILIRVPRAPDGAIVALPSMQLSSRATTAVRHPAVRHSSLVGAKATIFHPTVTTEKSDKDHGDRRTPPGLTEASPCMATVGEPPQCSIAAVRAPSARCTPQASRCVGLVHRRPRGGPRCTSPFVHHEPVV